MSRVFWLFLPVWSVMVACSEPQAPSGRASPGMMTGASTKQRPNVLILLTDDQQHDAIGALREPAANVSGPRTPVMDRLVRSGVAFTNTYIAGAIHGAVCMPSRAMLLTGRPFQHLPLSVTETWAVPSDQRGACPHVTLPEVFRAAGYATFGTGKWHNGRRLYARGFTDGGAIFFGGMCDHLKVPVYDFDPSGVYPAGQAHRGDSFSSTLFTDAAIDFLMRRPDDRPFFMYVAYTAPHDPRMPPEQYARLYGPETIDLPPNFMPEHPFAMGDLRIRDEMLAGFPRTAAEVRGHIAAYHAMISHLDSQIGRLLDVLEASGSAENTIIVLASDNGLALGQHGLMGKQSIYEHSARVPLVITGPGIRRGRRSEALCYLHDLFPTLCDLCGLEIPDSVESESLTPLIFGTREAVHDSIYLSYSTDAFTKSKDPRGFLRGVRQGSLKMIESSYGATHVDRLFDLSRDPWELDDLSVDQGKASDYSGMKVLLEQWQDRMGDTIPRDGPSDGVRDGRDSRP